MNKIRTPIEMLSDIDKGKYINLSIGEANKTTYQRIIDAANIAMQGGKTKYTDPRGIPLLRNKIVNKFSNLKCISDDKTVLIGSGVSNLLNLIFLTVISRGDCVVVVSPYYFSYINLLLHYGANIIFLNENFSRADLKNIKTKVKLIIFSNPSNPTGYCMRKQQQLELINFAEKQGAYIVSDEIYYLYDYDKKFFSIGELYDKALILRGFSKSYNMTGFRLAMLLTRNNILDKILKLHIDSDICTPEFIQYAGIEALDIDITETVNQYKRNRNLIVDKLNGLCTYTVPEGGFYLFARLSVDANHFIKTTAEKYSILLSDGKNFTRESNFIRISFCVDNIIFKDAVERIKVALKEIN